MAMHIGNRRGNNFTAREELDPAMTRPVDGARARAILRHQDAANYTWPIVTLRLEHPAISELLSTTRSRERARRQRLVPNRVARWASHAKYAGCSQGEAGPRACPEASDPATGLAVPWACHHPCDLRSAVDAYKQRNR